MDSNRPRIWVLDDVVFDAHRVREALSADYDVRLFHDGLSLIERLGQEPPPDGFIVDWVMPNMNGIDVCRYLRQHPQGARWAVLLLTARNQTEQIVEGLAAGADDYVAKPFVDAELRARVHAVMRAKRVLERATAAEHAVSSLLEHSPDAFLAISKQNTISYANEQAGRVFGCARASLLGRSASDLLGDLGGNEDASLRDLHLGDRVYSPQRWRNLPGTGGDIAISLRDVTEQRRLMTRRLDFYSMIAHDLRQPLNASLLRLAVLQQQGFGPLPQPATDSIVRVEHHLSFLVSLINDFLELAHLENADLLIEPQPLDVGALAQEVAEELAPLAEARQVRLRVKADSTRAVRGDVKRLRQAVGNLVSNAIKFSPVASEVHIKTCDHEGGVRIEVQDFGPGVDEAIRDRLFQRYTRATGDSAGQQSTGLGLMIVREVAAAHGGSVGVDTHEGQGSRFWIQLPADGVKHVWKKTA